MCLLDSYFSGAYLVYASPVFNAQDLRQRNELGVMACNYNLSREVEAEGQHFRPAWATEQDSVSKQQKRLGKATQ